MASITRRGTRWQAQIRRKGYPIQTKTFETKKEAKAWTAVVESEMNRGVFADRSEAEHTTLGKALERYANEITPHKRGAPQELRRIRQWQRHPLALRFLSSLRSVDFSQHRDARLQAGVAANTVRLELALVSNLFTVAREEWSIAVTNPLNTVRNPRLPRGRDRRLLKDEEIRLQAVAGNDLAFCMTLAIETGMRAGEIVNLTWDQIDLPVSVIRLDMTKNGDTRVVPLSDTAVEVIKARPRGINGGPLTRFRCSNRLSKSFRVACKQAGIVGLHFHDLRHEAASRLAPRVTVQTLAKIMGWRTLQMAMRYYNPSEQELVRAIRGAVAVTA
ncbi:MAG: site-specific integrase [Azonexus sp.]|jgi:integrase|nr:site-specific integrase [Azonexus sp.]